MTSQPKPKGGAPASYKADRAPFPVQSIQTLVGELRKLVGRRYVLKTRTSMSKYSNGYRYGCGDALCVARPGDLVQFWQCLKACVNSDAIIVLQSANTGLTGGSTPNGIYDRPVVIINTLRIKGIHLIDGGRQVICLPGSTLYELEAVLAPLGREPHSVIGSSCIGASVMGGICNNSGGALVQRGPAYTELALYAQQDASGALHLVNHLGIKLGDEPEEILRRLQLGSFLDSDVQSHSIGRASSCDYATRVRGIDEATPARFNADPSHLFETSGSAGKIALFAVRLDTFPKEEQTVTFYVGSNDVDDLAQLRRDILGAFKSLPVSCEYIHREAFEIAEEYGKDTVIAIERLGTKRLPFLFAAKAWIERCTSGLPQRFHQLSDHLLQRIARTLPQHLPSRMIEFRDRFEHHLILKMGSDGIDEARAYLGDRYPHDNGSMFECTKVEATKAFLHRFAVAGAAVRYRAVHAKAVGGIIALDVALRRNDSDWFEKLPEAIAGHVVKKLYYGHFLCHVFHQDYIIEKGVDAEQLEDQMLQILDRRGAEYPAEHNVGHLYHAKPALAAHYKKLDPCNNFNPGIGQTCRAKHWNAERTSSY